MIPRYSRPEMARIWEPETRFGIWLKIETYAAEAMAELGLIPVHAAEAVRKRGGFDIARIEAIEREVKHDVIAFLTSVAEHVGPEARFLHSGLTSSDVLDTCFNVQLVQAADILIADVDALLAALKAPRFRVQGHADRRPQPRRPCRADHVRAQARRRLCRVRPRAGAAAARPRGGRHLRHLRRRGHLRPCRSKGGRIRGKEARAEGRADLDPGRAARPARLLLRHARRGGKLGRAAGDRDQAFAADRGARGRGIFQRRAEGLLCHAA